jgi:hypothetical protein
VHHGKVPGAVMAGALLTALVTVALLTLAGCGTGASTGNAGVADTQAVIRQVTQGNIVNRDQATCIGDRAASKMSPKGLKLSKKLTTDLSDLPAADQTVVFDSYSACVTTAQLTPAITKSLVTGSGAADAASAKCFTTQLKAKYPRSGDLTSGGTSKLTKAMTKCLPTDQIEQSLITAMVGGGYTKAQATCVAEKVLTEVPLSKLTGATGASLSADVEAKIVAATQACSPTS